MVDLLEWNTPTGSVKLQRFTPDPTRSLRAWDAADEYLLNQLIDRNLLVGRCRCLLLNDEFGALATAVVKHHELTASSELILTSVNDSFIGCRATHSNRVNNSITDELNIDAVLATDGEPFDVVLVKIPKSLALLEDQLHRLQHRVTTQTHMLSAAMVKHLPVSVKPLIEKLMGPTSLSRAVKKARILETRPSPPNDPALSPYPVYHEVPELPGPLEHHAGVFAIRRLDFGSQFLVEHLPSTAGKRVILDMGCGAGLLGLVAAQQNPDAVLIFTDESAAAIRSAKANWQKLFPARQAHFQWQDCLEPPPAEPVDMILCNPPYHEKYHQSPSTAERMFEQARDVLRQGGRLVVVGNRHLDWGASLQRIFGQSRQLAQNKKYIIHQAKRR